MPTNVILVDIHQRAYRTRLVSIFADKKGFAILTYYAHGDPFVGKDTAHRVTLRHSEPISRLQAAAFRSVYQFDYISDL